MSSKCSLLWLELNIKRLETIVNHFIKKERFFTTWLIHLIKTLLTKRKNRSNRYITTKDVFRFTLMKVLKISKGRNGMIITVDIERLLNFWIFPVLNVHFIWVDHISLTFLETVTKINTYQEWPPNQTISVYRVEDGLTESKIVLVRGGDKKERRLGLLLLTVKVRKWNKVWNVVLELYKRKIGTSVVMSCKDKGKFLTSLTVSLDKLYFVDSPT